MSLHSYTIDFYYDAYEKEFGDGFYPLVKYEENSKTTMLETQIQFTLDLTGCWNQTSNDMICGLDGGHGTILLNLLNRKLTDSPTAIGTQIQNSLHIIIYPKPYFVKI